MKFGPGQLKSRLIRASFRHILTHPLQFFLAIFGVALGVAVVIAIDLASTSAEHSFTATTNTFTSNVTHKIESSSNVIDEMFYAKMRTHYPQLALAPILEGSIQLIDFPGQTFKVYGMNPLSEFNFRNFQVLNQNNTQVIPFISEPNSGYISKSMAEKLQLNTGDSLQILVNNNQKTLTVASLIESNEPNIKAALENVILCDIAVAQEILDQYGVISRIEINDRGQSIPDHLMGHAPSQYHLLKINNPGNALSQMTHAFRTNLQAMSLLALLVGMFLIYNTMTFSVLQRRNQFATLRTLGVSRKEIFKLVFLEALLIGIAGTLLGILLGLLLGKGLLGLVVQTINNLYFDLNLAQLHITPTSLFKGVLLGIGATVLSAWSPMREAFTTTPANNSNRSTLEIKRRTNTSFMAICGFATLLCGLILISLFNGNLIVDFLLLFFIFVGYALMIPWLVIQTVQFLRPFVAKYFGHLGAMSISNIINNLSRTGIALTALTLAVATTIGMTTMIGSFRGAVSDWLDQSLIEDVYLSFNSPASQRSNLNEINQLKTLLESKPEINNLSIRLWTKTNSTLGKFNLYVQDLPKIGFQKFRFLDNTTEVNFFRFQNENTLLISEPLATKQNLKVNDKLELMTDQGKSKFLIIGIYRDYTSDHGVISISRKTYSKFWLNPGVSSIGLYLQPDTSFKHFSQSLGDELNSLNNRLTTNITIRSNQDIQIQSIKIFDQTFAVTNVLRILTIIIAFIGILSALMALQLERGREFATLRVIGLTPKQLWRWLLFETSIMGMIAGILAIPIGLLLAAVLIYVINIQSFGWSMAMSPNGLDFLSSILLSTTAALLAGIYPAFKLSRTSPAESLRND